jgi:hypothetical protein
MGQDEFQNVPFRSGLQILTISHGIESADRPRNGQTQSWIDLSPLGPVLICGPPNNSKCLTFTKNYEQTLL